jgi:soluble lytic murein transglycosylase-like protein
MTRLLILCAIYYQAICHGFDPRMVAAQVFVESSFRPRVVNRGCYGLMQINYMVWRKELSVNPYKLVDIDYNLCKGLDILQIYYRQTGDIWKALHRYNNGPSGKYNNRDYVRKVRKLYNHLRIIASDATDGK